MFKDNTGADRISVSDLEQNQTHKYQLLTFCGLCRTREDGHPVGEIRRPVRINTDKATLTEVYHSRCDGFA